MRQIGLAGIFLVSILAFCGCSNKGEAPANVAIGTIMFQCDSGSAQLCESSSAGAVAYIGIADNTQATCASLIRSAGSDFSSVFLASGTASARWDGVSGLVGSVNDWVNSEHQTINALPAGTYRICAFLDVNPNGLLDSGEPYYSEIHSLGSSSSSLEIASWQQYDPNLPAAALSQLSPSLQF